MHPRFSAPSAPDPAAEPVSPRLWNRASAGSDGSECSRQMSPESRLRFAHKTPRVHRIETPPAQALGSSPAYRQSPFQSGCPAASSVCSDRPQPESPASRCAACTRRPELSSSAPQRPHRPLTQGHSCGPAASPCIPAYRDSPGSAGSPAYRNRCCEWSCVHRHPWTYAAPSPQAPHPAGCASSGI